MNNSDLDDATNSRRSFLKNSVLTTAALAVADFGLFAVSPLENNVNYAEIPWFKRITRAFARKPEIVTRGNREKFAAASIRPKNNGGCKQWSMPVRD